MANARIAKRKTGGLLENVKTIVYAGLIAIGIRTFIVEPFNIPSGSMEPTLLVGDFLFVSKFSYGYSRYSFPFAPPLFSGRLPDIMPHRGDVAVFRLPRDPTTDYIKRIIGLPGDTVQVKDGILYINGQPCPRTPDGNFTADMGGVPVVLRRYIETLPNGVKHPILKADDTGWANNTPEFKVPDGELFAMGDNRDDSLDSRFMDQVGFVPVENLVGPAEFIFFSIDLQYPLWEVWEWPFEIRWSRLFMPIR
jgi:signal peptidase I